jgi:hypothetical protein
MIPWVTLVLRSERELEEWLSTHPPYGDDIDREESIHPSCRKNSKKYLFWDFIGLNHQHYCLCGTCS